MSRKCCKSDPPCKGCPKLKKKKHRRCDGFCADVTVDREIRPIFYLTPMADASISGQRG